QVRLMHQGGALQGVIRAFRAQLPVGEPPKLSVHERHQLAERTVITAGPVVQQLGDPAIKRFVHGVCEGSCPCDAQSISDEAREYATEKCEWTARRPFP